MTKPKIIAFAVIALLMSAVIVGLYQISSILDARSEPPVLELPVRNSVYIDELTSHEVGWKLTHGVTRIIIPTGGIEQNGPYVALNKHDLIVREVCGRAARQLGDTLVAPVVSFVPEGEISPPTLHMQYPGTISIRGSTFRSLLEDIIGSFATHGVREIVVLGDSGDSQPGMAEAVEASRAKAARTSLVRFLASYYDYDEPRRFLRAQGLVETPPRFHEELAFSLQLLAIDPDAIRYDDRVAAGMAVINGVSIADRAKMTDFGNRILDARAQRLAEAIRRPAAPPSPQP